MFFKALPVASRQAGLPEFRTVETMSTSSDISRSFPGAETAGAETGREMGQPFVVESFHPERQGRNPDVPQISA
jgi:hypothetical protein